MRTRLLLWKWKLANWRENCAIFVAWHLPRSIVRWAAIRVAVNAEPNGNPADATVGDALKIWG